MPLKFFNHGISEKSIYFFQTGNAQFSFCCRRWNCYRYLPVIFWFFEADLKDYFRVNMLEMLLNLNIQNKYPD